jgi:outer membrane protein, multidrug efflux system
MRQRYVILLLLATGLAGCKVGRDYRGTELRVPEAYYFDQTPEARPEQVAGRLINTDTLAGEGLSALQWSGVFPDPALNRLIALALEANQDVNIAAEAILQAQDGLVIQRSAMLPTLGVDLGASRGNFQGALLPDPQNLFYVSAFANWEIDFWGKYRRLNEAAQARLLQSEAGYRAVQLSLIGAVANQYYLLLEYRSRQEIAVRNLALRDSMMSIIQMRYEGGMVAEIDVNQAQINRAIAAEALPLWERLIAQTEHSLSVLTGDIPRRIPIELGLMEQDTSLQIPAGLPSQLLLRRPDLLAAEQNLIAQNALVGVAVANRFPNISLTGLLGIASNELSGLTSNPLAWNGGGSLLWPLFNFGRLKRQVSVEQSRRRQAELDYQRSALEAFRSVEDALVEIATLKVELRAREQRLQAALNAQRLSAERYNRGVTSYLEYLESQRQAFDSEQNYTGARRELLSARVRLFVALGGAW